MAKIVKRPNILLISIDTLRADHLSCYGYHRETTPNIDRLANEGTIYLQHYSTGVWTPPGHASMLTGLYVCEHGVYGENRLADDIPTIATILKEHGFQTAGFVNNSQVGKLVGFHKGHDLFVEVWKESPYKNSIERILKGGFRRFKDYLGYEDMGAKRTNELFFKWINSIERDKPFYCFLHYIEPHNPLKPPRPYKDKFLIEIKQISSDVIARGQSPRSNLLNKFDMKKVKKVAYNPLICYVEDITLNYGEIEILKALYDGEIAYTDFIVGQLISILKNNDLYDNTMIIVTSDHGEHFGEHGCWSHVASLYKEVLQVPLIIKYPSDIRINGEINRYTQSVDILPTILDILGISSLEHMFSGFSLIDKNSHEYIFAEWEGRVPYFIQDKVEAKAKDKVNNEVEDKSKVEDIINKFETQMAMIQDMEYKYIWKSDGSEEIYDISDGKEELLNIQVQKEVKERLSSELLKKHRPMKDIEESTNYSIDNEIAKNLKVLGYM